METDCKVEAAPGRPEGKIVRLKRELGRVGEKALLHPWIYSGAVGAVDGFPESGDVVRVVDKTGLFVGWGHFSVSGGICVRIISFDERLYPDEEFLRGKVMGAVALRRRLPERIPTDCRRLVFSESDGLPGVVADQYGDFLVVQLQTKGMMRNKKEIAAALLEATGAKGVFERCDGDSRDEGLQGESGLLAGEPPPAQLLVTENGLKFNVDITSGQKTGLFLDQRENRALVSSYVRPGHAFLDCFSYTGAFGLAAARQGAARVCMVDSSGEALVAAKKNFEVNGLPMDSTEFVEANVFQLLRSFRDSRRTFDVIVLDPPKLAPSKAQAPKALRAYKDLNLLAMKLLSPEGVLATFSCSGAVSREEFEQMLRWAATDAGREARVLERLSQPPDHPVSLRIPEAAYLKGVICHIL